MTPVPPPARKHLGQNFLVDPNIVRKIVEAAALTSEETVLEIGPGRGVLTRALCAVTRRVQAVEIDPRLCAYLREALADCPNLELYEGDALHWPLDQLPQESAVVANLPYYLSTPLLLRLLDARPRLSRAVVMLQAEVAHRLVARPGTKDYGSLSVAVQRASEPRVLFRVSPNSFRPRPEVDSAVVSLTMCRSTLSVEVERVCQRLVRSAFAHRRKRVVNSLRDEGWSAEEIDLVRQALAPRPDRRAEEVSPAEFADIANRVAAWTGATGSDQ
ncbi:ribosomal RNA small subunit methyltransferase A [Nitrospira sp.]|nr:ribosomal RNA small subunit methyltransferase A [Nitrospira sp.]